MANYASLKAAIQQVVKTNGNNEITGALLQQSLLAMVNSLGANYQYAGVAIPSTNPGTPDQNIFYIASTAGTYVNFGGLVLDDGDEIAILKYNGAWSKDSTGAASLEKFNQLGQQLQQKTFNINDFTVHKYIRPSDGWAIDNDNYRITDFVPVKTGDVIAYKLYPNVSAGIAIYSQPLLTSFVETLVPNTDDFVEGTITINQDGYILCGTLYVEIDNCYIAFQGSLSALLQKNTEELRGAITPIGNETKNNTFALLNENAKESLSAESIVNAKYIRNDGYIGDSNSSKTTDFIPVKAGDVIEYRLFGSGTTLNLIAFYTNNIYTSFVSMLLTSPDSKICEGELTIQEDGYIVVCNSNMYADAYLRFKHLKDDDETIIDAPTLNLGLENVFHDNFSRTEEHWDIGKNSAGSSTANSYDLQPGYDDGLRVDDGATFVLDSSRSNNFSVRKINAVLDDNFVIETNAPAISNNVCFGFNFVNVENFDLLRVNYNGTRFNITYTEIRNKSFGDTLLNVNVYKTKAQVMSLIFNGDKVYVKFDDTISAVMKRCRTMNDKLYLASYKGFATHYDFVNIFNCKTPKVFNPNHILDTGDDSYPTITLSANPGGYELQNIIKRYEGYADKFHLTSSDTPIHNGIRAENSIDTLVPTNLREYNVEFDVYIPSSDNEDSIGDIMCQMHDRDGSVARGFVPFIIEYKNGKLYLSLASTYSPASTDITRHIESLEIATIDKDKWIHLEFYLKERYEKEQHPLTIVKVNGEVVYISHEPNCFNDVAPSELQYGIYKSVWGEGVTERTRYFDNLIIGYNLSYV